MKRIHIFKTGTHTDSHGQTLTFSESDLAAAVAAYDPALHQAPIVVGHPKTDNPAYGWVQSLMADAANLFATPEQVNPEFSEQVANGAYKKVSASFYPPTSPANPKPGAYYLRHVGFLGAEPPAIKGLQPIEFSESDDAVTLTVDFAEAKKSAFDSFVSAMQTLFFGEDKAVDTTTHDQNLKPDTQKDSSMSDPTNPATPPVPPVAPTAPATPPAAAPPVDATDKDAQIAALQAQLDAKAQAESTAKTAAAEKENADFSESLVADGKVAPSEKSIITAMLDALDRDSASTPVEFGEGDAKQPLKAALKAKLSDANANTFAHLFSESATKPTGTVNANFDAPAGTSIDADRLAMHQQALTYSEAHKVDYATAIIAIGG